MPVEFAPCYICRCFEQWISQIKNGFVSLCTSLHFVQLVPLRFLTGIGMKRRQSINCSSSQDCQLSWEDISYLPETDVGISTSRCLGLNQQFQTNIYSYPVLNDYEYLVLLIMIVDLGSYLWSTLETHGSSWNFLPCRGLHGAGLSQDLDQLQQQVRQQHAEATQLRRRKHLASAAAVQRDSGLGFWCSCWLVKHGIQGTIMK